MRILFVNHLKPTTASFLRQTGLGRELSKAGHEVSYIGRRPSKTIERYGKLSGIAPLETISEGPSNISYWFEPFEPLTPRNIVRLLEISRDYEVIHVNKAYPYTSTLLSVPKLLAGKAIVIDWEDWDGIGGYINFAGKNLPSRFALGFFEEVVPKSCNAIVAVSKILANRAERKGIPQDKIFYIPNGYDESLFDQKLSGDRVRKVLDIGSRPTILLVSALHAYERENFKKIFDSLQYVAKQVPDVLLLIAGQGEVDMILQYAQSLGIRENVMCLGFVPHAVIPEVIAAADVAIHVLNDNIYFRSSSPMVVPEYMAMGKAIVGSAVGELNTMLGDGAGILVKHQSPKEFGRAIVSLLTDSGLKKRTEETALARAKAIYSYKSLAKRAELAYAKALEK
ncbi:MAG: glycosyltransferase [Nitrososphaerota archaeon]|nr:glycosyltransferase [Nitrososphaerota archaeon]